MPLEWLIWPKATPCMYYLKNSDEDDLKIIDNPTGIWGQWTMDDLGY